MQFNVTNKCKYHPQTDVQYICVQKDCTSDYRLFCKTCSQQQHQYPHLNHQTIEVSNFLQQVREFKEKDFNQMQSFLNKEEMELIILEKLQLIRKEFDSWYDVYIQRIRKSYQEMYQSEEKYIQTLLVLKQTLDTILKPGVLEILPSDCDFLVKLPQNQINETIQKLQSIKNQIFLQLVDPLEKIDQELKDILLPTIGKQIEHKKFSRRLTTGIDQQQLEKVKQNIQFYVGQEVKQHSISPPNIQILRTDNLEYAPKPQLLVQKKGDLSNSSNILTVPGQRQQQTTQERSPIPSNTKEITSYLAKRNLLRQQTYKHIQNKLNCRQSGRELVCQMFLSEDEDGKDWEYQTAQMIFETDCQEGTEFNDEMTHLCEKLYDLGYRDDLQKDIVKGWFICLH